MAKLLYMFNIQIICLGKLKEKHWREAETEYLKRLKSYAKIKLIEVPEESFRDTDNPETIKQKEAEKIKKNLPKDSLIIALHERGQEFSSIELSEFLQKNSVHGETIVFIIGGPLGLHESILKLAHKQISLSRLTFPHQMVRTIFLEQVYRCGTILNDKKYHY